MTAEQKNFIEMIGNAAVSYYKTYGILTYKKPEDGKPHITGIQVKKTAFELFDLSYLETERTFRIIQSKIIKMVNEFDLKEVPDDKSIENWLKQYAKRMEINILSNKNKKHAMYLACFLFLAI